jgi:hypothetical protein
MTLLAGSNYQKDVALYTLSSVRKPSFPPSQNPPAYASRSPSLPPDLPLLLIRLVRPLPVPALGLCPLDPVALLRHRLLHDRSPCRLQVLRRRQRLGLERSVVGVRDRVGCWVPLLWLQLWRRSGRGDRGLGASSLHGPGSTATLDDCSLVLGQPTGEPVFNPSSSSSRSWSPC